MLMAFTEFLFGNEMLVSVTNEYMLSKLLFMWIERITESHKCSACIFCCPLCIKSNIYCFGFLYFVGIGVVLYNHVINSDFLRITLWWVGSLVGHIDLHLKVQIFFCFFCAPGLLALVWQWVVLLIVRDGFLRPQLTSHLFVR